MKRFLRTEVGERIDHPDFQYGIEAGPRDAINGMVDSLLVGERAVTEPQNPKSFVVHGFTVRHGGGDVWVVEKDDLTGEGSAVMAFREGGEIKYGCVLVGGESRKQIDISPAGFPNATYGVYVRLEFRDVDQGNRLFWNATASTPVEFPRNIPTRRAEDWAITVEQSDPGDDWMHIADVNKPGNTATDRRDFYFEGRDDNSFAVVDAEWGDSDDRSNFRETQGVFGFYRYVRAVQRLIQEIKADGVGWWIAPAKGLAELLALDGSRSMTGDLNASPADTHALGVNTAARWLSAQILTVNADDLFPSTAPGAGQVGADVAPYGEAYFADSFISLGTAVRGAVALGGSLEVGVVGAAGDAQLLFNDDFLQTVADSNLARVLVDSTTGGDSFVEIQSGINASEGANSIRLNGTNVRIAKICEGQNGLVFVTFAVGPFSWLIPQTHRATVTTLSAAFTPPASGNVLAADRVIGIIPDATLQASLGSNISLSHARMTGTNTVALYATNVGRESYPVGRVGKGEDLSALVGSTQTLENLEEANFDGSYVGLNIRILTNIAANNGVFPITAAPDSQHLEFTNASGVVDTGFDGTWVIEPAGSLGTQALAGNITFVILRA